MQFAIDVVS